MELVGIEDAAIPITVVRADVLAQERKSLPIIEEFILRLVAAGVDEVDDIAGLLGIDAALVINSAAIQITENNLQRSRSNQLTLTPEGREVARDVAATQPVYKELPVVFDRLIWALTDYSRSLLLQKRDAEERGLIILPARKNSRIGLNDINAETFNDLLRSREGRQRQVEILRVRRVSPNTHRYYPVQLLIYGDTDRGEIELGVCIDGELATDHSTALDAIGACERLGLSVGVPEPRDPLPDELERIRVDAGEVLSLESSGESDGSMQSGVSLVSKLPVRSVSVFEHADLLADALENARERLLIVSPWVRSAVVTTDFIAKLERRLRAGVEVTLAHGYGPDDRGSDEHALRRLENLRARYQDRFLLSRLGNTHAKILIYDDCWISTSFNWLSFRGDPERTYRIEEGTMVTLAPAVSREYQKYRQLAMATG